MWMLAKLAGCQARATIEPPAKRQNGTSNALVDANRYVGDAACQACHAEIAQAYRQHPMGRSLAPTAELLQDDQAAFTESATLEAGGFRYDVRVEQGQLFHTQSRVSTRGEMLAKIDHPVRYVVGSGHHGQSFLIEQQGRLFMSPLTWYPDKHQWDLSPGYEVNNSQFNRPVTEQCLFCHANQALLVADSLNHYQSPPFLGHAIGCERCHGPGQRHVAFHESTPVAGAAQVAGATQTQDEIVNPVRLPPARREAVCQQCHLSGLARVLQPAKSLFDFRPGQELDDCFAFFLGAGPSGSEDRFVGQVEQMYASACFQQSDGRLGCISCHDPHRVAGPATRIDYIDRCLDCHTGESCSEQLDRRQQTQPADDCIACHMPQRPTEVRHASTTDHRVLKRPGALQASSETLTQIQPFPPSDAPPSERDGAIARVMAQDARAIRLSDWELESLTRTLESAVGRDPRDDVALEALAVLHERTGDMESAYRRHLQVLQRKPRRETSLVALAEIAERSGNWAAAESYWRSAIDVNPWMSRYWFALARVYARLGDWSRCREISQQAINRFPSSIGARQMLVESQLQGGDTDAARTSMQWLHQFRPDGLEALNRWYESHPLRHRQ